MSKTADNIIERLEDLERESGYSFEFLQHRYDDVINGYATGEVPKGSDPFAVLAERAKTFGDPDIAEKLDAIAQRTGYEFDFLLKEYKVQISDGQTEAPALAYVEGVSDEQDW